MCDGSECSPGSITLGAQAIAAIRRRCPDLLMDVHVVSANMLGLVKPIAAAGGNRFVLQFESLSSDFSSSAASFHVGQISNSCSSGSSGSSSGSSGSSGSSDSSISSVSESGNLMDLLDRISAHVGASVQRFLMQEAGVALLLRELDPSDEATGTPERAIQVLFQVRLAVLQGIFEASWLGIRGYERDVGRVGVGGVDVDVRLSDDDVIETVKSEIMSENLEALNAALQYGATYQQQENDPDSLDLSKVVCQALSMAVLNQLMILPTSRTLDDFSREIAISISSPAVHDAYRSLLARIATYLVRCIRSLAIARAAHADGMTAGLALAPDTAIELLAPLLRINAAMESSGSIDSSASLGWSPSAFSASQCLFQSSCTFAKAENVPMFELVDVLAVRPGYGGQDFDSQVLRKVKYLKEQHPQLAHIAVDGGVDTETGGQAAAEGANVLIAGSSVFLLPTTTPSTATVSAGRALSGSGGPSASPVVVVKRQSRTVVDGDAHIRVQLQELREVLSQRGL